MDLFSPRFFLLLCLVPARLCAHLFLPEPEGYARMEVLVCTPNIILCKLEVSGGPRSEILAIKPDAEPKLIWRIASDQPRWDAREIEGAGLFTLEGNRLQQRNPETGEVQKQLDLNEIKTPVSEKRPWTDWERELVTLKKDRKPHLENGALENKAWALKIDIEAAKKEWAIREQLANSMAAPYPGIWFASKFDSSRKEHLSVLRNQWMYRSGTVEALSSEVIDFEADTFRPVEISGTGTRPSTASSDLEDLPMLHVLGEKEYEKMDEEEVEAEIVLIASDLEKRATLWRVEIPVYIKKNSAPSRQPENNTP